MPNRPVPFWRRHEPAVEHDVAILLRSSSNKDRHFETPGDVNKESRRSQEILARYRPGNEYATYLSECRDGHYHCEQTYCPRCARSFRRYLVGELLRLCAEFNGPVKISTVLLQSAPKGKLRTLEIARHKHALRKRLVRAGLGDVAVIGGVEVVYRTLEKVWILHVNLALFGSDPKAIAAFAKTSKKSELYRPIETVDLKDPAEQLSYLLKFTTYHRPLRQTGPTKSPAKPLNPPEHYELVNWMAQHQFTDHLFLFNARRHGSTIRFSRSARKA